MSDLQGQSRRRLDLNHSVIPEQSYQMDPLLRPQQRLSSTIKTRDEPETPEFDAHSTEPFFNRSEDNSKVKINPIAVVETSVLRLGLIWLPEILASVLSAGILVAMALALAHYNGRALNDIDLPVGLTLNGLIAILSTLARVCIMVPTASVLSQEAWLWFSDPKQPRRLRDLEKSEGAARGVLGSLVFLLTSPRRIIASLGALVTILSLAFGTFTQQLVTNAYISVTDTSFLPGEIPRGETYSYHEGDPSEPAPEIPQAPIPMRAAFYNGMMTDISQLTAHCPTGNCTWPVTTSLAVCGACSISTYTTPCNTGAWAEMDGTEDVWCNYTLPDSSILSLSRDDKTASYDGFGVVPSSKGHLYNISLGNKAYIANFFAVGYSINSLSPANFSAYECALWWCVNAYQISTQASVQKTDIVYTQHTLNASGYPSSETYAHNPGNDILFDNLTFPPFPADIQKQFNLSASTAAIEYRVMPISLVTLRGYTKTIINGTGTLASHATYSSNDIVETTWSAASSLSSMEAWVSRVAMSLSNYIRDPTASTFVAVGSQPRPDFAGSATILGIVVRWSWFVLPLAIVSLSMSLLVATMVRSANSPVGVWKGSWLMYLFCELSPDVKGLVEGRRLGVGRLAWNASSGRKDERGAMSVGDFIRDSRVRLRQEENGGWVFGAS